MNQPRGTVVSLQICAAPGTPMEMKTNLRAITNLGFEGDAHAKPNSARQVLLMDVETLAEFKLDVAQVRENITTRGIELQTLAPGTRLRVGGALFETTKTCAPCEFIEAIRPGLRAAIEGQRGMLARVIQGGALRVGDPIEIVSVE